ncbi:MAG: OmpA family protein [Thermonemataceae bacterium]
MLKHYSATVELAPDNRNYMGAYYTLAGESLKQGDYKAAKTYAQKFLTFNPTPAEYVTETKRIIESADYAKIAMKTPLDFKAVPIGDQVNRPNYLQYFPVLTADQSSLIFTSLLNKLDGDENLLISRRLEDGSWSAPESLSTRINTPSNEGTCSISADGKTLVFTSCAGRENFGSCDLFISKKYGDEWTEPINMGGNINTGAWESQPALSADGKTLYFISDRRKGYGKDIYVSYLDDNDEWQPALNLGDSVNTKGEELSPFIHANGKTLFFSSNGYVGLGGLDLFKTSYEAGNWTEPVNLGYPINDYNDQVSLFVTIDGKKAYYADEKKQGRRYVSSQLMAFDMPSEATVQEKSNYVKGTVYDAVTKKPIAAQVELFNITDDTRTYTVTSDKLNGSYLIVLTEGAEFALEVSKKQYAFKSINFNNNEKKLDSLQPVEIDIFHAPIAKGTKVTLNNIFFDTGKYDIKEKSKTELEKFIQFMEDNPQVKGEISGHTDNVGDAASNVTLSLQRAKAVYNYLIKNGVDANRLRYQGYGQTQPTATNDTPEGRQLNRRIEFKVL